MTVKLRRKELKDGRESLYLDIYFKGKRSYEFLRLYLYPYSSPYQKANREVLELAERIKAKRLLELQHVKYGFTPDFKGRLDVIEYFRKLIDKRRLQRKDCTTWITTLGHLEKFAPGGLRFEEIDENWMINFRTFLETGRNPNAVRGYFGAFKNALYQAVRDRIILDNPALHVKNPKITETKRDFLTYEEVRKLHTVPSKNEELKRAFLFGCYSGLRWSDIIHLKWEDIRFNDIGEWQIHFKQRKTSGVEYLPLNAPAISLLGDKMEEGKVFNLRPSDNKGYYISDWIKEAGINKHITFHCSRHTFAVMLLEKGVKIYTVSKLLGHRDLKTTLVYANILDETKRKAVNSLSEFDVNITENELERTG